MSSSASAGGSDAGDLDDGVSEPACPVEWVVGKRFGDRELFILLDERFSAVGDAMDEVARLKATVMSSILMP